MSIEFNCNNYDLNISFNIYSEFIKEIFIEEGYLCEDININIVSDNELKEINNKFLKKNDFTDTISFPVIKKNQIGGDVIISYDRVKDNSIIFSNNNFKDEFNRVLIHSILHLIGYNDYTKKEIKQIRIKENYYLKKLILHLK